MMKNIKNKVQNFYKRWNIEYDGPIIGSFALLWPLQHLSWNKKVNPEEADKMLKKVRKIVIESFSLGKTIGVSIESKYRDTLSFLDCVEKEYGSNEKSET